MKKRYSRPLLAFESFQLDAALAAGCPIVMKWGVNRCSVDLNGTTYPGAGGEFFNYQNCQTDLVGTGDNNESVCYHGPTATWNITDVFLYS